MSASAEMYPLGVRRDGSLYTRVHWTDTTENDPTFWVNNLIDDDLERCGGTWGANSETAANCVLDFFGETQSFRKIAIYKNVGLDISVLEELARTVNIYVSADDSPAKLRRKENRVDEAAWTKIAAIEVIKEEGWQEIALDAPVEAKYVRVELVDNFCKRDASFIPWIEMSEIKLYR